MEITIKIKIPDQEVQGVEPKTIEEAVVRNLLGTIIWNGDDEYNISEAEIIK